MKDKAQQPGTAVSVSNTEATIVLTENRDRREFVLTNVGANKIFVFLGTGAETGKGIPLSKEGGQYINNTYTGIITAKAETGATSLAVAAV